MGFRSPLDLTSILAQHQPTLPTKEEAEAMRKVQEPDSGLRHEKPVRLGWGPERWSTSMALVPFERVCHDVNGYYRELGVDWRASRKELREAYVALDGQSSARLTYVFKQLLNPAVREAYDKSPRGELFLDDYTQDDLKRRAHEEAARRSTLGQTVSWDEVLGDWGYVVQDPGEDSPDGVDNVRSPRNDWSHRKASWEYGYYAWQTESFLPDVDRLQKWQELLSSASSRAGSSPEMAIGATSMTRLSDQSFIIEHVGGRPVVFFFADVEPTAEIAEQVIAEFPNFP